MNETMETSDHLREEVRKRMERLETKRDELQMRVHLASPKPKYGRSGRE